MKQNELNWAGTQYTDKCHLEVQTTLCRIKGYRRETPQRLLVWILY